MKPGASSATRTPQMRHRTIAFDWTPIKLLSRCISAELLDRQWLIELSHRPTSIESLTDRPSSCHCVPVIESADIGRIASSLLRRTSMESLHRWALSKSTYGHLDGPQSNLGVDGFRENGRIVGVTIVTDEIGVRLPEVLNRDRPFRVGFPRCASRAGRQKVSLNNDPCGSHSGFIPHESTGHRMSPSSLRNALRIMFDHCIVSEQLRPQCTVNRQRATYRQAIDTSTM